MILTPSNLHGYQRTGVQHILEHRASMLWMDMGLGKTITTLTAIAHLLDCFEIRGALVIAPLRVVQTVWKQEAARWENTKHLQVRLIHGIPQTRKRSIMTPADVYVVNYENLPWLVNELRIGYLSRGRPLPFDMVVYDEITKTKSTRIQQGSTRMRDFFAPLLGFRSCNFITIPLLFYLYQVADLVDHAADHWCIVMFYGLIDLFQAQCANSAFLALVITDRAFH